MSDDLQQQLQQHACCVRSLAVALLRDDHAAEDVVQETLLAADGARAPRLRSPRAWLLQVARRLAARRVRSEQRRRRHEALHQATEPRPAAEEVERSEQLRAIADAVAALPPLLRDAVMLRHFDELPPRQIAERLGISVEAVESRLRRGHEQLRRELRRFAPGGDVRGALLAFVVPVGGGGSAAVRVHPAGASSAMVVTGGVVSSKSKSMVAVVVLLVVLAGVGVCAWLVGDPGVETPQPIAAAATPDPRETPDAVGEPLRPPDREAARADGAVAAGVVDWTVELRGRVVDTRRRPVPDAAVVVEFDGAVRARGHADGDGQFALRIPAERRDFVRGGVLAQHDDGCGVAEFSAKTSTPDVGGLVVTLEPSGSLEVRVQQGDRVVAGADVRVVRGSFGAAVVRRHRATGRDGTARFEALPRGRYALGASGPSGIRVCGHVDVLPGTRGAVVLDAADTVPVTVQVCSAFERRPIAGAQLGGWFAPDPSTASDVPLERLFEMPRTDEFGRAVVLGLRSHQRVHVTARHPEWAPSWDMGGLVVWNDRGAQHVSVELRPPGATTWRLVEGDVSLPPDGTVFRVAERSVVLTDGCLRVDAFSIGSGTVAYGPGCHAVLAFDDGPPSEHGLTASLLRSRSLGLRITDMDGAPLAFARIGVWVHHTHHVLVTDELGRAELDDLARHVGEIAGCGEHGRETEHRFDLTSRDAELTLTFAPQRVRVRVSVDGRPELPGDYALRCMDWQITDVVEDAAAGQIEFTVLRHDAHRSFLVELHAMTAGLCDARALVTPQEGTAEVELQLSRTYSATLDVEPPADGRAHVVLQREVRGAVWDACEQQVEPRNPLPVFGLEPGRYRLRDADSGVTGEAVEIGPCDPHAELPLDLSRVCGASGQVLASDLEDIDLVVCWPSGEVQRRVSVRASGHFRVRADLSQPLVLYAERDGARSAPTVWTDPVHGLVLVLPD